MKEEWKQLKNECFQGKYYISNFGRLKRISYKYLHRGVVEKIKPEKYINPKPNNYGYLQYYVNYNKKMYGFTIHRLVAETFIPNPNNLSDVDHIDNNKLNNRVDNLQWLSHLDNMRKYRQTDKAKNIDKQHGAITSLSCQVRNLIKQDFIEISKYVFEYNGKLYNKVSNIFEDQQNTFKDYHQCWYECIIKGKAKKKLITYLSFKL